MVGGESALPRKSPQSKDEKSLRRRAEAVKRPRSGVTLPGSRISRVAVAVMAPRDGEDAQAVMRRHSLNYDAVPPGEFRPAGELRCAERRQQAIC